jgi:hypothetical protein
MANHSSPVKADSGAFSKWLATQFSLTFYDSTGVGRAEDSLCHLWNQFPWRFLSGQRVSFPWLFMSEQGLCGMTNPRVTSGNIFGDDLREGSDSVFLDCFWVNRCCVRWVFHASSVEAVSNVILSGQRLSFPWLLMSEQGLCGLTNTFVTCERSYGGYLWVGSDSVFLDCLWVNRGCVGWRIHSSPLKAVSGAISEWAATQFSLTFYDSTGVVRAEDSLCHLWKQFRWPFISSQLLSFPWLFMSQQGLCAMTIPRVTSGNIFGDDFWEGSDFFFLDCFWVNRCCVRWAFHASTVEAVLKVIFEWATTQFSLTVNEWTGAMWADESIRHLWKQFRGLFVSG